MHHHEETFAGRADLTIHLQSWLPDGDPHTVVVIAHGFGEHSGRYGNVVDTLVPQGYAVYAPDHRGHGKSQGHRALIDNHEYLLDDMDQVFSIASARHPGVPTFLLGHSMGGNIALASALRRQSHLRGLVLSGPLVTNEGIPALLVRLAPLLGRIAPRLGTKALSAEMVSSDPAVVAAYVADPLVFHGKVPAGTGAALIRIAKEFPARLPSLSVPLMVVHGSADTLVPVGNGRTAHKLAGSTDKTLKVYDGLFHEVFNEPQRATVLADVLAWLEAHR
jgi:alpha-beta hydrolase superfamily lysophospholipase